MVNFFVKTAFLSVLFCFWVSYSAAQLWTKLDATKPIEPTIQYNTDKSGNMRVEVSVNAYFLQKLQLDNGVAYTVHTPNGTPCMQKGAPDLPKIAKSVVVTQPMYISATDVQYTDIPDVDVAPSKGNLSRSIVPDTVPFWYGNEYQSTALFPSQTALIREPYTFRNFSGQTLVFYPFAYNAGTRTLRVYTRISVTLSVADNSKNMALKYEPTTVNQTFEPIYKRHFINYSDAAKYTPLHDEGNMLIVSHASFLNTLKPLVAWKQKRGIRVELIDIATIGNATALKNYVANYYHQKGLTFLLLAGDGQHIQPLSKTGDSDAAYGHIDGNDSYPEVIVGRFSAETVDEMKTQVQRTIDYEQNPQQADWYSKAVLIGSAEGPGDDGEYDFQHMRNIRPDLLGYTYTVADELFDGSQGGADASGSPSKSLLASKINEGRGLINYVGHGSYSSFGTTGFSSGDVRALANNNKLPFLISVACQNGNFDGQTCFGEAWLRSTRDAQPIGAIAALASTINQSWNPPMDGQDEMNDILTEKYADNIKRSFGGIVANGCMHMNDQYGAEGYEITNTWTLFGDPSLLVRTTTPFSLTVEHATDLMHGVSEMIVNCTTEGATAALTFGDTLLATANVQNGMAYLHFAPLQNIDSVTLTVTAYNAVPHTANLLLRPATGPYISMLQNSLIELSTQRNGVIEYGEKIGIDLTIKNIGVEGAQNTNIVVTTSSPYIIMQQSSFDIPQINAGQTIMIEKVADFIVAKNVPDGYVSRFEVTITDGEHKWLSSFTCKAFAPQPHISFLRIDDKQGNNNSKLDIGEKARLWVRVHNNGGADAQNVDCSIKSNTSQLYIKQMSYNIGFIPSGGYTDTVYDISTDTDILAGTGVEISLAANDGEYSYNNVSYLKVGQIIEDFETGNFSQYKWKWTGNATWTITESSRWDGTFAARSGVIGNEKTTALTIDLDVLTNDTLSFYKRVSSEAGYDYLHFYIDGQKVGSWSGVSEWSEVRYPITAGRHNLKWAYVKDYLEGHGDDAAWIDAIELPAHNAVNSLPRFTTTPIVEVLPTAEYKYEIKALDDNLGDVVKFNLQQQQQWITLVDSGNGKAIIKAPASKQQVSYPVVLRATDGTDTIFQAFTIIANTKPFFASQPVLSAYEDSLYTYDIVTQDNDSAAVLDVTCVKKPSWLNFASTGNGIARISGVPTQDDVGNSEIKFFVSDGLSSREQVFFLATENVNDVPQFITQPGTQAWIGMQYQYAAIVTDLDVNATIQLNCIEKPEWLTFTPIVNGVAMLFGFPPQSGMYNVKISATDGLSKSIEQIFTINAQIVGITNTEANTKLSWINRAGDMKQLFVPDSYRSAQWQVFDLTGKQVSISFTQQGNTVSFDTSSLSQGFYIIKAQTQDTYQTILFDVVR